MRYAEFRDELEGALVGAGLLFREGDRRVETIDLADTGRTWTARLLRLSPRRVEPFHVSAEISFTWGPAQSARGHTCEEDLLTELVGRRSRPLRTERRWVRVDLSLHASLPWGSTTPLPEPGLLGAWTATVAEEAAATFDDFKEKAGRVAAVLGGHGELEVTARPAPDGTLSLASVTMSGFGIVTIPRVWDDPERRQAERQQVGGLRRLAGRFKSAFDGWTNAVSDLATWIRYSPPDPAAKPVEPWFDADSGAEPGDDDDDEGGPETTH
jgi:hypothetical protein